MYSGLNPLQCSSFAYRQLALVVGVGLGGHGDGDGFGFGSWVELAR